MAQIFQLSHKKRGRATFSLALLRKYDDMISGFHEQPCPSTDLIKCGPLHCIHKDKQCDGKRDCPDGTDEENCSKFISFSIGICLFYR